MFRLGVNSGIKVNTKATFERLFQINVDTFLHQWSVYSVILFSKNWVKVSRQDILHTLSLLLKVSCCGLDCSLGVVNNCFKRHLLHYWVDFDQT